MNWTIISLSILALWCVAGFWWLLGWRDWNRLDWGRKTTYLRMFGTGPLVWVLALLFFGLHQWAIHRRIKRKKKK